MEYRKTLDPYYNRHPTTKADLLAEIDRIERAIKRWRGTDLAIFIPQAKETLDADMRLLLSGALPYRLTAV